MYISPQFYPKGLVFIHVFTIQIWVVFSCCFYRRHDHDWKFRCLVPTSPGRSPIPMPTSSNQIPRTSHDALVHCHSWILYDQPKSCDSFWKQNGLHFVMGFALFKI